MTNGNCVPLLKFSTCASATWPWVLEPSSSRPVVTSPKTVQAWENLERDLNAQTDQSGPQRPLQITPQGALSQGNPSEEPLPIDSEERLTVACRLVSERSLYGVDKNPMAVEMAKLSLWLITLAKNKPFTFLDHNLRCGDSLLGADERQLHNGSLDAKSGEVTQMSQISYAMQYILPTVIEKRRQIATLADFDITIIQHKERLLKEADQALEIVKLGADLLIGIALSDAKRRAGLQGTLGMDYVVLAKAFDEALHQRQTDFGWAAKNEEFARLRAEVDTLLKGKHPFHWPLEFPEVFVGKGDDAGFAAVVGNPPFQGGKKITGVLGTDYRDYLLEYLANSKRGNADLCAYFFLRATKLASQEAMCALLATNTIAQGDTREVGLDQIVASGWIIPRAIPSRKWPGEASLEVAHIWLRNGTWKSCYLLDERPVNTITPFLTQSGGIVGTPYKLSSNANKSFQGSIVLGMGFILAHEEAQALIAKNPRNKDVLFPYLNGEDLNFSPNQSPRRWVINFRDWPLEQAEMYPDCMNILKEKVKPERQRKNDKGEYALRKPLPDKWWIYADKRPALYSTIADMKQVLVKARIANMHAVVYVTNNWIFNEKVVVFANCSFTVLQSNIHEAWAQHFSATLESRLQYAPSDCFENFPFPLIEENLEEIGERYHSHRQSIMLANQEGLTKTYNRFHDLHEQSADILKLRELHKEMDEAVAHAYGWDDLALGHGFHETKQGMRYTICEAERREVLDRLLLLNHARHEEEVAQGLHEKGVKSVKGGKKKVEARQDGSNSRKKSDKSDVVQQGPTLFDLDGVG